MSQIHLLRSLPKTKRHINGRANPETVKIAKQFGEVYFDGPRQYGYGGYKYDGRWLTVARDIIAFFDLKPKMRVLDVGCAKGFLVKDLLQLCPGLDVFGLDISEYALKNCEPEVVGKLHLGSATSLPFPNASFDVVLSINTLHNLPRESIIIALQEIERVGKGKSFIQVDAYRNQEEKDLFEKWKLTAEYYVYPEEWLKLFIEAGYTGNYDWTILEDN